MTYADIQQFNPSRLPNWRFQRVLEIIDQLPLPGRCSKHDDDYVRQARSVLLRWRRSEQTRKELFRENPGLCMAYQIYEQTPEEPETAHLLQLRLLANQSPESIAEAESMDPETVRWFEALFFNVLDRLQCRDWIVARVIIPAISRQVHWHPRVLRAGRSSLDCAIARLFVDPWMKLLAYCGGPLLVDSLILGLKAGDQPHSTDDIASWYDRQFSQVIRLRSNLASLQFPVDQSNVMKLFASHARLLKMEKGKAGFDQNHTPLEQHVKAFIRCLPWDIGNENNSTSSVSVPGESSAPPAAQPHNNDPAGPVRSP